MEVLAAERGRYELSALGASGRNVDALVAQALAWEPKVVAVEVDDGVVTAELAERLPMCEVRAGVGALASLAEDADVVVNGVVGFAGLSVTLATLWKVAGMS